MTNMKECFEVTTALACLGYAVFAVIAALESFDLLKQSYTVRDGVLYIPLQICRPSQISIDGTTVSFDAEDGVECKSLSYLVNACAASLFFSALACLLFILSRIMTAYKLGSTRLRSILGMGLLPLFMLLQSAICSYALYNQSDFYLDYFRDFLDIAQETPGWQGIDEVQMHGNIDFFLYSSVAALGVALLILVQLVYFDICAAAKEERKLETLEARSDVHLTPNKSLDEIHASNSHLASPAPTVESPAPPSTPPSSGHVGPSSSSSAGPSWTTM